MNNNILNFELETTSVWSFPERGNWATHSGEYPGNWSPYVPRNLLLRYSNKYDWILDPFVGSGTTAIEAALLNRNFIGVDINKNAVNISKRKISGIKKECHSIIRCGDACKLSFIISNSIDFVCLHPPYCNIIKYSKGIIGDISLLEERDFFFKMVQVAKESYRVMKDGKYLALLIADMRKNGNIIPLGFKTMQVFCENGFILKEIIIKEQHNCRSTTKWTDIGELRNFLLIKHEYLFVFKKI